MLYSTLPGHIHVERRVRTCVPSGRRLPEARSLVSASVTDSSTCRHSMHSHLTTVGAYYDSITPWDFTSFSACRKALKRESPRSERCVLPNGLMHVLLLPGSGLSSLGPDTHPGRDAFGGVDLVACPPLPAAAFQPCRVAVEPTRGIRAHFPCTAHPLNPHTTHTESCTEQKNSCGAQSPFSCHRSLRGPEKYQTEKGHKGADRADPPQVFGVRCTLGHGSTVRRAPAVPCRPIAPPCPLPHLHRVQCQRVRQPSPTPRLTACCLSVARSQSGRRLAPPPTQRTTRRRRSPSSRPRKSTQPTPHPR